MSERMCGRRGDALPTWSVTVILRSPQHTRQDESKIMKVDYGKLHLLLAGYGRDKHGVDKVFTIEW